MKLFVRASSFTVVLCAIAIAFFAIQTSARQSTPAGAAPQAALQATLAKYCLTCES